MIHKGKFLEKFKATTHSRWFIFIQLLFMVLWGTQLLFSDSYYVVYVILLILTGICSYQNIKTGVLLLCNNKSHNKFVTIVINLFAVVFSCMIASANYKVWNTTNIPAFFGVKFWRVYRKFLAISFFLGGYLAFWNIFNVISSNLKLISWKHNDNTKIKPTAAFIFSFTLLVLTRCILLYYCQYPGELTPDSIGQMSQVMTGNFSNHHPFYHTMVIKFFVDLGLYIFKDINAAVATYSFFQILFTSMCFSFGVSTVSRMNTPRWMVITSMAFFVMMPYHILYAITMWKDVMFGCFVLLFVTFIYRSLANLGNTIFNYIMLSISSIGTCLFRSNGFFVFVIISFAFILLWKFKYKKILILFISTIIISFIMKHNIMTELGVPQPDTIESLSIPAQQIARVIYEGYQLDDWERDVLDDIIEIDKIPDIYSAHVSDPIKNLVRQKGNQKMISERKEKYIKLYFSLGSKYPFVYMRGWIDQTCGYWNSGYDYWRWSYEVHENNLGIERTTRSISLDRRFREYWWLFTNIQILRVFLSIGLFVWIDILMLMISLLRKDKLGIFVSLPILAIVISLLLATPVFSEFRYIYAAFCALPIVIVIVLRPVLSTESNGL